MFNSWLLKYEDKKEFSKKSSLALKGIAITIMMFHHCFRDKRLFAGYDISFFPLSQDQAIKLCVFFKICVSMFAFITGYGLILSYRKKKISNGKQVGKWTIDRLIKMLSGFWVIAILSMIIFQLIDGRTGQVLFQGCRIKGIFNVLTNLSGLGYLFGTELLNGTWWYMSIAILFVASIPILVNLIDKYGYIICGFLLIAIPRLVGWKFSGNSYFGFIFMLYLGMLCADNNLVVKFANYQIIKKNIILNKLLKFLIETFIVFILYKIYNSIPLEKYWEISFGVIPLFIIMYLYEFYLNLPVINKVLEFLGKHSMNIFLSHTLLREKYLHNFVFSRGNFILCTMSLLLISLGISIIVELLKKVIRYEKIIEILRNKICIKEKREIKTDSE